MLWSFMYICHCVYLIWLTSFFYLSSRMLVTNRDWSGSMKFYTNCRQTWAVENFFSHTLLPNCPKQKSNGYDAYHIRNMLAVMDYKNHLEGCHWLDRMEKCMLKNRYPGGPNSRLHMRRKHQKILNIYQVILNIKETLKICDEQMI